MCDRCSVSRAYFVAEMPTDSVFFSFLAPFILSSLSFLLASRSFSLPFPFHPVIWRVKHGLYCRYLTGKEGTLARVWRSGRFLHLLLCRCHRCSALFCSACSACEPVCACEHGNQPRLVRRSRPRTARCSACISHALSFLARDRESRRERELFFAPTGC